MYGMAQTKYHIPLRHAIEQIYSSQQSIDAKSSGTAQISSEQQSSKSDSNPYVAAIQAWLKTLPSKPESWRMKIDRCALITMSKFRNLTEDDYPPRVITDLAIHAMRELPNEWEDAMMSLRGSFADRDLGKFNEGCKLARRLIDHAVERWKSEGGEDITTVMEAFRSDIHKLESIRTRYEGVGAMN